jgi:hypothetical protein
LTPEQIHQLPEEERRRLSAALDETFELPHPLDVPCPACSYTRPVLSPAESAALTPDELLAAMDSAEAKPDWEAVPVQVLLQVHRMTLNGWP